jgi:hypothetical protein
MIAVNVWDGCQQVHAGARPFGGNGRKRPTTGGRDRTVEIVEDMMAIIVQYAQVFRLLPVT